MNENNRRVRLVITGRVQGVGYRAWGQHTAQSLGLNGWFRNSSDNSVEALLEGDSEKIAQAIEACRSGPSLARVSGINCVDETPIGDLNGVKILR